MCYSDCEVMCMNIGQRIKEARKNAGLTQRELAEKSGTATGTIQQYELGKRQPRLEQLRAIAAALGVQVVDLLGPYDGPPLPGLVDGDSMEEVEPFHYSPNLLPSEFNEFERFIESLGYYTRMDGDNYRLHKGRASVVVTPDELKALVRASRATVAALVQDLMVVESATPPSDAPEMPSEGE